MMSLIPSSLCKKLPLWGLLLLLSGGSACSYYSLGAKKPKSLENVNTVYVEVFKNNSVYPRAEVLLTSALSQQMSSNGLFSLAPKDKADAFIRGTITYVGLSQLQSQWYDTYKSLQTGLTLGVKYDVVDAKTGKVLRSSSTTSTANYFNKGDGQSDRWNAYSYAARRAAEQMTLQITN